MADKLIHIKIRDAQQTIFEGEIDRISSFNEVGPFDIYPMHANLISIIINSLTLYKNGSKIKDLEFEKAVMKVKKDEVKIFLGIETINLDEENENNEDFVTTNKTQKPPIHQKKHTDNTDKL